MLHRASLSMRADVKWCPVVLPERKGISNTGEMSAPRIRPGTRALLAVKVHAIQAVLCNGHEAHIGVLLRYACDDIL